MKLLSWFSGPLSGDSKSFSNPFLPKQFNIYLTLEPLKSKKEREHIQIDLSKLLSKLNKNSSESITCEDMLNFYQSQFDDKIKHIYPSNKCTLSDFNFFLIDKTNEDTQFKIPLTYTPYTDLYNSTNELFFINSKNQDKYMEERAFEIVPLFEPQTQFDLSFMNTVQSPPQPSKSKFFNKDTISDSCLFLYRKKLVWLEEKIILDDKKIRYTFQGMENHTELDKIQKMYFGMKSLIKVEPNLELLVDKKEENHLLGISGPKTICIFIIKNKYSQFAKRLKDMKFRKGEKSLEQKYNSDITSKIKSIGKKSQDIINSTFYCNQYISYEFFRNYFSVQISNKVYADIIESILEYKAFYKDNNLLFSWSLAKKLMSLMKTPLDNTEDKVNKGSLIPFDKIEKLNNILVNCDESLKDMKSKTSEDMQKEFNRKLKNILTFELFDEIVLCISLYMKELQSLNKNKYNFDNIGKFILMFYFLRHNKCLGFVSIKNNIAKKMRVFGRKSLV